MSPHVGFVLYYLPDTEEFAEVLPNGYVSSAPLDAIIIRGIYLSEAEAQGVGIVQARQHLGQPDALLLRLFPSTDGPPFRSALVYVNSGNESMLREGEVHIPSARQAGELGLRAVRYSAIRAESSVVWELDALHGRPGFILTGTAGWGELWRMRRIEADALGRQILTLAPTRLAFGVATPDFGSVLDPRLRRHLEENFEQFSRAVASNAYLDVVNRANMLVEGVLRHCLTLVGREPPSKLSQLLKAAQTELDDPEGRKTFPFNYYAYHLAHKIRLLHGQTHADQAVSKGHVIRPETGLAVAIDMSEILVSVGLGHYR